MLFVILFFCEFEDEVLLFMFDVLLIVYWSVENFGVGFGDIVVVFGSGFIGLMI